MGTYVESFASKIGHSRRSIGRRLVISLIAGTNRSFHPGQSSTRPRKDLPVHDLPVWCGNTRCAQSLGGHRSPHEAAESAGQGRLRRGLEHRLGLVL